MLTDCAVPLFYVISGYLYFLKSDSFTWQGYRNKISKKCVTLLLPYFVWNVIGIIAYPHGFLDASLSEKLLGFWSCKMEWGSWSGPWDGPLWFMRDLFVVMLFGPIISVLIKRLGILLPVLLAIPYLCHIRAICPGITSVSFFYFSIGSYLAIKKPCFSRVFDMKYFMLIISCLTLIFFVLRWLAMGHIIQQWSFGVNFLWTLVSMTFYFCLADRIGTTTHHFDKWKLIGTSSFVIYAMHSLINGRISSTLLFLVGKQNVGWGLTLTFYTLTIVFTVAICYATHILISRNKTASLLLEGGRTR